MLTKLFCQSVYSKNFLLCVSYLLCFLVFKLPPPRNLSLSWAHCSLTAKWSKPTDLDSGCKVNYTVILCSNEICITIMTNPLMCENKKKSKPVHQCISPPKALVNNFSCIYYSDKKMNCSWNFLSNISDLQFHYGVLRERFSQRPCTSYITSGPLKTGCHMHSDDIAEKMCLIINRTTEHDPTNSFVIEPREIVKPWPPKLKIIREGEYLHFQSSTPDFQPHCWQHMYMYSKCKEKVRPSLLRVPYDEACRYTVRVQANYSPYCGKGASDWSEPEYYDVDPNWPLMVAVIVIPVIVSCCLITALVLFKRHKDIILPAIPEPSLLFKDMLNSNNDGLSKVGVGKLYVPIKEVVEKDVSLEPKSVLYPGP
uniref:Type I cytokine receptor cytokine-binding domain-containing protein n=1 Tax=Electrophorus electricus TaxID=8005 RepID=A0A4W4ENN2_ELEEL